MDGPAAYLPRPQYRAVMGDFFETMRIPLLKGRRFTAQDSAKAPWVVLINETMARRYWPGEDPIGKRLTVEYAGFGASVQGERPREIVGVVGDVHEWSLQNEPCGARKRYGGE